jgi:putative acetyltransferase
MTVPIEIRPERPDEPQVTALLGALDAYLATLYPPEANHILGVDELMSPGVTFLAAWDGDTAVGCGAVRRLGGEPATGGKAYAEIKRMYVAPSHRGRGLARLMLERLESLIAAEGLDLALLETGRDQTEAVRLYERCGYRLHGAFNGYPDNGLSLFLGKALRP